MAIEMTSLIWLAVFGVSALLFIRSKRRQLTARKQVEEWQKKYGQVVGAIRRTDTFNTSVTVISPIVAILSLVAATVSLTAGEVERASLEDHLTANEQRGDRQLGTVGFFAAHLLQVSDGSSESFLVPRTFTGRLVIRSQAGDYQKMFSLRLGSCVEGTFKDCDRSILTMRDQMMPSTTIEKVASQTNMWKVVQVPVSIEKRSLRVALLGVKEE